MRSRVPVLLFCLAVLCLAGARRSYAQAAPAQRALAAERVPPAEGRSAVLRRAPVGVGDVGAELLEEERVPRRYRTERAAMPLQLQNEGTTAALKQGALIGGVAGLAAGAAVGALLGGDGNQRVETAFPGALAGLAVGAPVGVYLRTERAPRYRWGAASAVGAVGLATLIFIAE